MENNKFDLTNTVLEIQTSLEVECKEVKIPDHPEPVKALTFQLKNSQVAVNHFKFLSSDNHLNYALTSKEEATRLIELLQNLRDQL